MIRYPVTKKILLEKIEAASPGWLARAINNPKNGIWNKVRDVYTRIQHGKCAYCERLLSDPSQVNSGHGRPVDHFRPKTLYPLLAHEPLNYAVACIDCNSALKKSQFPVEAARKDKETNPAELKREKPLLIYPIGAVDENPEALITFNGYIAMAVAKKGYRKRRAIETLKLFHTGPEINSTRREILRERAERICAIWVNPKRWADYESPDQAHANCCRSFVKLCQTSPDTAKKLYELADEFLHPSVTVRRRGPKRKT